MEKYEETKDSTFLQRYFDAAWEDKRVLSHLMDRVYPKLKAIEADIANRSPVQLVLHVGGKQLVLGDQGPDELSEGRQSPALQLSKRRQVLPSPPAGAPRV